MTDVIRGLFAGSVVSLKASAPMRPHLQHGYTSLRRRDYPSNESYLESNKADAAVSNDASHVSCQHRLKSLAHSGARYMLKHIYSVNNVRAWTYDSATMAAK